MECLIIWEQSREFSELTIFPFPKQKKGICEKMLYKSITLCLDH